MSEHFLSLIAEVRELVNQTEEQPNANRALLNEARLAIYSAEQMLTHHPDCAKDKTLHFAFKSHLDRARKAVAMVRAEPRLQRDHARQAGTRKPRRPKINEWIERQLRRKPNAKSPELWLRAPDWITEQIGKDRFAKRVTAVRGTLGQKREKTAASK